jgi:hypothetical protein
MEEKNRTPRGMTPEPAETGRDSQQHEHKAKEGDYRNAQTPSGTTSYADNNFGTEGENDITREEPKKGDE